MPEDKTQTPTAVSEESPAPAPTGADSAPQDGQVFDLEKAMAEAPPETWDALYKLIPDDHRTRLLEPDVDRRAQSRADRTDSTTKLEQDKRDITETAGGQWDAILDGYDQHEEKSAILGNFDKARQVVGDMTDKLRARDFEHAARTRPWLREMGETALADVERAFASTRGQSPLVTYQAVLDAIHEKSTAFAAAQSTGKAGEEAKGQTDAAKILADVFKKAEAAGQQTSSTEIGAAVSGGSDTERIARIASGTGTAEDARWLNDKYPGQGGRPRGA